jgi:arylsulfatase
VKNILFVTADQLRWDTLGFEGRFPVETPNIDALAGGGTVFENAYCANPLCVPSRAALMTGRPCHDNGVFYNDQHIRPGMATMPGELSRNNFYSVAVGKMHFRPQRANLGFDKRIADNYDYEQYLAEMGCTEPLHPPPGGGDGTPHFGPRIVAEYTMPAWGAPLELHHSHYVADAAISELESIAKRRNLAPLANEPFFMWLSFIKPHTPCNPPEPYFSMVNPADVPPPVCSPDEIARFPRQLQWYQSHWTVLNETMTRNLRARYLGEVALVDAQIGRVVARLKEMGIWENTIVVMSADHGDHLGDHHLHQKSFFFDCSAKVPFIFHGPGIPAGKRVSENVSLIDLMPTLLDMNRLTMPDIRDGNGRPLYDYQDFGSARSLCPLLDGTAGREAGGRIVVSESGTHGLHIMAKKGSHKYNYYADTGEVEFFDLEKDPDELDNHIGQFNLQSLPGDIRACIEESLEKSAAFENKSYALGKNRAGRDVIRQIFS